MKNHSTFFSPASFTYAAMGDVNNDGMIKIVDKIKIRLAIDFSFEKENNKTTFAPIDILDYI